MNNTPIIDPYIYEYFNSPGFKLVFSNVFSRINDIAGGWGGVFWSEASDIFFNNSLFIKNEAYTGGVGIFKKNFKTYFSKILIQNSLFLSNIAGPTSGVFHFMEFFELNVKIFNCNFTSNYGRSKKFDLLFYNFH